MPATPELLATTTAYKSDVQYVFDNLPELESANLKNKYGINPPILSERIVLPNGNDLRIVDDTYQDGETFKRRGAAIAAHQAKLHIPELKRLVAGTRGNHGAGVGYAALALGLEASIYGVDFVDVKYNRMSALPNVEIHDNFETFSDALEAAARDGDQDEYAHYIHPFDDKDVILGQATLALQTFQLLEKVGEGGRPTNMYVPVGGAGLIAGTTLAREYKQAHNVRIVGVEVADKETSKLCEGTATKRGKLPGFILEQFEIPVITVRSDQVAGAILRLENSAILGKRVEGAAALSYAGAIADSANASRETLQLSLVTGTGISKDTYNSLGNLVINGCGNDPLV